MTAIDNHVGALRCWIFKYDDEFVVITGELDIDFTGLNPWNDYKLVQATLKPAFNVFSVFHDEEGYSYPGHFDPDGYLVLSTRAHLPEANIQILRFFVMGMSHQ